MIFDIPYCRSVFMSVPYPHNFRNAGMLLTYQSRHHENSANGITNKSIKILVLLALMLIVALAIAREMTTVRPENDNIHLNLNFFLITCCWAIFSSGWMLWNEEARTFTFRKFCMMKNRGIGQKRTRRNQAENQICHDCKPYDICANCIVEAVISKKPSTIASYSSEIRQTTLPGSVYM